MSNNHNHQFGREGEDLALNHLLELDFVLVDRNFQFYTIGQQGRQGELDLIVIKDNILHLVEVKNRSSQLVFGQIAEQITKSQLKNLYRAYLFFIKKNPQFSNYFCQLDVATVFNNRVEIIYNAYSFESLGG